MTQERKKLVELKNVSLTFNKENQTRLRLLMTLALISMRAKFLD